MPKPQPKTPAFASASAGKQNFLILAILFFLPSYLVKIKYGWASFNVLELLVGVLFLVWVFNKNTKYKIRNTKYKVPVLLIFVGLALSTLTNHNYYVGLGAIKGWFAFPVVFAIVFYDALKKDESLLKKSFLALFLSGVAVSAIGAVYKLLGIVTFDNRLAIFWDSPNQLAMFLAIPFLIGFSRLDLKKNYYQLLGVVLIGINLYFSNSFGAWLGIVVALAIIVWLRYGEYDSKKYLAALAIVLIIFLGLIASSKYDQTKNLGDRSSLASRMMIWKSAVEMAKNNPLFGIGPGNFQNRYLEYQKYFPLYLEWSAPQPHNLFLAFWLQSGLVGLAGFVQILILFFRDNKIAIKEDRDLGILFFGIMIYMLIHGLVDTTYWRNDLAVMFWVLIAANFCLADSSDS